VIELVQVFFVLGVFLEVYVFVGLGRKEVEGCVVSSF